MSNLQAPRSVYKDEYSSTQSKCYAEHQLQLVQLQQHWQSQLEQQHHMNPVESFSPLHDFQHQPQFPSQQPVYQFQGQIGVNFPSSSGINPMMDTPSQLMAANIDHHPTFHHQQPNINLHSQQQQQQPPLYMFQSFPPYHQSHHYLVDTHGVSFYYGIPSSTPSISDNDNVQLNQLNVHNSVNYNVGGPLPMENVHETGSSSAVEMSTLHISYNNDSAVTTFFNDNEKPNSSVQSNTTPITASTADTTTAVSTSISDTRNLESEGSVKGTEERCLSFPIIATDPYAIYERGQAKLDGVSLNNSTPCYNSDPMIDIKTSTSEPSWSTPRLSTSPISTGYTSSPIEETDLKSPAADSYKSPLRTSSLLSLQSPSYSNKVSKPTKCSRARSVPNISQTNPLILGAHTTQPGPIPASRPELKFDPETGDEILTFSYSKQKIITNFTIKCPSVPKRAEDLPEEFLLNNCVYPRAMVPIEKYKGNRGKYERECNEIGWNLSWHNPEIRGQRGIIQRAVDSWRNTRIDKTLRSRRVRKRGD